MAGQREAMFWKEKEDDTVECELCPHNCTIKNGRRGICGIRENVNGILVPRAYGIYPAVHSDPIEKKPLYHFLPGESILSVGSVGCNLNCRYCQNWSLSKDNIDGKDGFYISPEEMVRGAKREGSVGIAFTYNEPTINAEYILDAGPLLRREDMKMVLVTNGFLSPEPWDRIMEYTDGANIDVKGFTERFYRDLTGSRLEPILRNVKSAFERSVHVELTYLVIPGYNDSPEEVDEYLNWVKENISDDIPLHFTRFHPDYKMSDVPATPVDTLERIMKQCERAGMKYFYIGNVLLNDYNNTGCPECGKVVIKRSGFSIKTKGLKHGKCSSCGAPIRGVFDS